MTQEDKELLLKDLCARLLYGVIVKYRSQEGEGDVQLWGGNITYVLQLGHGWWKECKPYLRPISSMTDEEMDQLFDILRIDKDGNDEDWIKINDDLGIKFFFPTGKWVENVAEAYDYLNSIHIDYRGLIAKGLALEAPEGMYK